VLHTTTPDQLAALLRSGLRPGRSVIGIDGAGGSGKSTLAEKLGPMLGAQVLSVDAFLNRNEGQYVKSLRLDELRTQLAAARGPTIVEGICLLQVLDALSVTYDQLVYVKLMEGGRWDHAEECDVAGDPKPRIAELLERAREFDLAMGDEPAASLPASLEEVIWYHAKYRPQDRATVEYWTTL
jgi:hypothetical protein